uniref:Uncharacterized protein n=1 Tax=Arundo donax TaxID=35708 RepID=A0A0A8ZWK2_ARUDO
MSDGGNEDAGGGAIHIVMYPWLAFGHISPFAQLARKLVSGEAGVRVTFLTAAGNVPRVEAMLASAADAVTVVPLHLPHVPGLPAGAASTAELSADGAELLKVAVDGTRPQVSALLAELHPDAVLIDFATPWVCDIAAPLGATVLYFCVFAAVSFAYLTVPARLLRGQRPSAHDLTVAPAGFPPVSALAFVPACQGADLTYVYTSFYGMPYVYDRATAGVKGSAAFVMKTCPEMEGPYVDYISSQYDKPVLLAGPVVPEPPQGELEERWANWLSSFPDNAVVFASFGSETFLTVAAATELLLGLEATHRPFLVVLNFPKGADAEAQGAHPTGLRGEGEGQRAGAHGVGAAAAHPAAPERRYLLEPRRIQLRRRGPRRRLPAGAATDEDRPALQRRVVRARAPCRGGGGAARRGRVVWERGRERRGRRRGGGRR